MGLEEEEGGFEISLFRLSFKHNAEGSETSIHPHITDAEQLLVFCGLCFRLLAPLHFCPSLTLWLFFFFLRNKTLQIPKVHWYMFSENDLRAQARLLGQQCSWDQKRPHLLAGESIPKFSFPWQSLVSAWAGVQHISVGPRTFMWKPVDLPRQLCK